MRRITKTQSAVLDHIESYINMNGFAPSAYDITEAFGWKSPNSAHLHLKALETRGLINIARGVARGITITHREKTPDPEEMASALRIISTWAKFDRDQNELRALNPGDVIALCHKALRLGAA